MRSQARVTVAAVALAVVLLLTGTLHFVAPRGFESIVPPFLGSPARGSELIARRDRPLATIRVVD